MSIAVGQIYRTNREGKFNCLLVTVVQPSWSDISPNQSVVVHCDNEGKREMTCIGYGSYKRSKPRFAPYWVSNDSLKVLPLIR